MSDYPMPVIKLIPDRSGYSYQPANPKAVALHELLGRTISDRDLVLIEELGFQVVFPNGEPLPFPKDAYKKKPYVAAKHIYDEA